MKDEDIFPSARKDEVKALTSSSSVLCGRCDTYVVRVASHHEHEGMHCSSCPCAEELSSVPASAH